MHFLVDAQLPRSFCEVLRGSGHQVSHVADLLSMSASDHEIVQVARRLQAVIVTKDADFSHLLRHQPDLQVVWMRVGNVGKRLLAERFALVQAEVELRLARGERLIEVR